MLVSRLGAAGIGVETVLDHWAKADSTNAKMLLGRFSYYFTKAQTTEVVSKPGKKYLGMEPLLTLKDSLGNDVYYYQHNVFDDELYGQAIKAADKAIAHHPDRLDFRFMKANAYIAYEKESPDMALAYLFSLIDEDGKRSQPWSYGDEEAEPDFFEEAMQEYCYSFYSIGSDTSREAFRRISEKLSGIYPSNPEFVNNIGSYYLLKHDYKTALKYYNKVLKKHPGDMTAIQNALLAAKHMKNAKLEKKYQAMMAKNN
jgi:tetratricopeptide (TPR) repeat protein